LLFLCVTVCANSQSTDATISGQVVDPSGKVIPDADIEILNEATGVHYSTKTNGSGIFSIPILPPGEYRTQVSKEGFKTIIKPGVILNVQSAIVLNFTLPVGATSESVTVEADSISINTTDASVSTVIDQKFVANIPLNGRSFQDLISMTPGIVTQSPQSGSSLATNGDFSVNGQRTESNNYTVDGVTANITAGNGYGGPQSGTGGSLGGSTALGTTQSLVSVDALQEFRVQSSTYSAEYGRSPGGQFSLVTRSGTDTVHGSAFDYLRNNFFDANDWFNDHYVKPAPALRQNDFGGTLGGPVIIPRVYDGRNRTFFFVSYEGLRLAQPTAAAIQYVPDTFMRLQAPAAIQPILNAYPVQNGIDYGTSASPSLAQFIAPFSLPSQIDSTSIRLDHSLTSKHSLFFRYANTPSSTSSRPFFSLEQTRINVQTYTLGTTSRFSSKFDNEFRLGYDRSNSTNQGTVDKFGGATPINLASAVGAGSFQQPYPVIVIYFPGIGLSDFAVPDSNNLSRQWDLVDTLDVLSGHHNLKFGIDYRRIKSPLTPSSPEPYALFENTHSILDNSPTFAEVIISLPATPLFNETAVFAQDEWRVSSRVGLSLGLRWELDPPPTEAHGNDAYTLLGSISDPSSLTLAPQGTPLWNTTWFNFAPRIGLAWTANDTAGRETVMRIGAGIFYDNLNQVAAQGYEGLGFTAYNTLSQPSLPFTPEQLDIPVSVSPPYSSAVVYAFPAHAQQPYTLEWNASIQQALGRAQSLNISYVGANGRRLIGQQQLSLANLNPNFGDVDYLPSGITSNYQALQLQFQRSVTHGVQALASYTWSHSIDFGSSANELPLTRGNSDFDVRNNLQGGLSWDLPRAVTSKALASLINNWAIDGRIVARTAFPVSLTGSSYTDPNTGNLYYGGLNLIPNQPIYLNGSEYPGGKAVNRAAFGIPPTLASGDAPRDFVRGFGMTQMNLAIRREFPLHDPLALQFRAEAFNILNHPDFGYVDPNLSDATFGQATKMLNSSLGTLASQYQQGGPRSMQFALKVRF
jgi:hypothetical protein